MKASNKKTGLPLPSKKKATRNYDSEKHLRLFCDATSQELATTLGALVGELDYALTSTNPQVRERSTLIAISAAERALSLARNLRYFSIHTRVSTQVVDLAQTILDTVELIEKELELNQIKITVLAEASTYARVDSAAIQQVVLNLLANARKSLPAGGTVTLSLRQNNNQIEIRCQDTGKGMAESEVEQVFEPYIPQSPEIEAPPHNLGLAVSKALVESQGGEIHVQTRMGTGTTVSVLLPFDPSLKRPTGFAEERRFRRIKLALPVEVFLSRGQSTIHSVLTTLSVGGCYARISDPNTQSLPELNDTVSVRIQYFGQEILEIPRGRIASVSWAGVHSGIGIEFAELDTRSRKLLEAIVKSHSA